MNDTPGLPPLHVALPALNTNPSNNNNINNNKPTSSKPVTFCQSCDRCRARKTKCDGKTPCTNCTNKYLKKHKLSVTTTNIDAIDPNAFECVYSPAKRRGPVPGRAAGQARKAAEMGGGKGGVGVGLGTMNQQQQQQQHQHALNTLNQNGNMNMNGLMMNMALANANNNNNSNGVVGKTTNSNLMRMDLGGVMGTGTGTAGVGGATATAANNNFLLQQQLASLSSNKNNNNSNNTNGTQDNGGSGNDVSGGDAGMNDPLAIQRQFLLQQQQLMLQGMNGGNNTGTGTVSNTANDNATNNNNNTTVNNNNNMDPNNIMSQQAALTNPLAFNMMQQQLQLQQQQQVLNSLMQQMQEQQQNNNNTNNNTNTNNSATATTSNSTTTTPALKMMRHMPDNTNAHKSSKLTNNVKNHLPLLEKSSIVGNRLRSYYTLAMDVLFKFPPIPSDEEYCSKLNIAMNPMVLPQFDLAAIRAARFAELALGALINNQIPLSLALSNAVVSYLKCCAEEPVHPSCMYEVARAYFLHALYRSYRGDMVRYFKYRRVCLTKLAVLDADWSNKGVEALLAALSFHDAWAYMIYNANEALLPNIDSSIPPVTMPSSTGIEFTSAVNKKYQVSTDPQVIVADKKNQMWIQGPPPVFVNNEAPPLSRSLDALACAIRSCCDQANSRMFEIKAAVGGGNGDGSGEGGDTMMESKDDPTSSKSRVSCGFSAGLSDTTKAVMANEAELCSRNMVLSAFTLLQQSEATQPKMEKNYAHHLLISAMDAFLESGDEEEAGGFTDSQIQSLLSVSNTVISRPLLLYQAGPTFHIACNTAVQLCHLLNGLHANRVELSTAGCNGTGREENEMEVVLFEEVLDTYIALRKVLEVHRRKLPIILRCHGLPRPNLFATKEGQPLVDLAETKLCASRGCQGFVLTGCSPCVAAERAVAADLRREQEMDVYGERGETMVSSEVDMDDGGVGQLSSELGIEDDDLIAILGKTVSG
jgi:hypothetical protein